MDRNDLADSKFENDIFALAMKAMEEAKTDKRTEKTAIVIGEKETGKSTLIAHLTGEEAKADAAPTAGIDYKFAVKKVESKKVVGNFLEIGGGRLLSGLLATPLNSSKLLDSVLIITIDMSKPDVALHHLEYWVKVAKETINKALEDLEASNPTAASRIREQSAFKFDGHPDSRLISPVGIPTIIVGTKYDIFSLQESENKKWMCRALRYFAHTYGWDLALWSNREKDFDVLKHITNIHLYRSQKELKPQTDHGKILCVLAGQDKLTAIGDPAIPGNLTLSQAWMMSVESYFPIKNKIVEDEDDQKELGDISKFREPKVDAMKQQKDEELDRYKKEAEIKKRFESQKKGGKKLVVKKVVKSKRPEDDQ